MPSFNFTAKIQKENGTILKMTVSAESELRARLKAKQMANTFKGKFIGFEKIDEVPYEVKDKSKLDLQKAMFLH